MVGRSFRSVELREQIRSWIFEKAMPFWAANGVDAVHGGFVEQLTLDGRDTGVAFKRTRVAARQVYAFSHARMLGYNGSSDIARVGIDFLIKRTWQGNDRGFARVMSRTGDILDPTPDLYDHAFALFAFAWRYRATNDTEARHWMHVTLDFIESHLSHPGGEGFWHELPPTGWRLQNPHMHLTEACLAAFESTGETRFADASLRLVELFQKRLFDHTTATLPEYFDDNWQPAVDEEGWRVEPGHMMEWAWVLNQARKLIGATTHNTIRRLVSCAEQHGVDGRSGVTFNAMRNDGLPLDRGSRIWPNTERLKAAIALYETDDVDPWPVIEQTTALLLSRFLTRSKPGVWMDAIDAEGQDAAGIVPASSLYHLMLAFSEVLRIAD